MTQQAVPEYADFDDYRHTQHVAVAIRWLLLFFWMVLRHYNAPYNAREIQIDVIGAVLIAMNVWLQYRLWKGRPVGREVAMWASIADLAAITVGLGIAGGFVNTYFILYYPALVGMAVVVSSTVRSATLVTVTAGAYALISMLVEPGIDVRFGDEKALIIRIVVMYSSVLVAYLIMRTERRRRREAVASERAEAARGLELQKKAQQAELRAAEQRFRIGRDIHDGIAQNLYGLTLNLESAADAARSGNVEATSAKLDALLPLAKQALLETRHYMHDLRPLLGRGGDLCSSVESLATEFQTIAGIKVDVQVKGDRRPVSEERAVQMCRIVQEALANVMRHSGATRVSLEVVYDNGTVSLAVRDDGRGFNTGSTHTGFGLENMRTRALEIGGATDIISSPGNGTQVLVSIPVGEKS